MTEVIDFLSKRLEKMGRDGEMNFILCPSCHGHNWSVVCMSNGDKPYIAAIACMSEACEDENVIGVVNGVLK